MHVKRVEKRNTSNICTICSVLALLVCRIIYREMTRPLKTKVDTCKGSFKKQGLQVAYYSNVFLVRHSDVSDQGSNILLF